MMPKYSIRQKMGLLVFKYLQLPAIAKNAGLTIDQVNRLTSDWTTSTRSINEEIRTTLYLRRARSRELCTFNDYGRKFMNLCKTNIVGPNGVQFHSMASEKINGKDVADDPAIEQIESAFSRWSEKGNCTVCGQYSLKDIEDLTATATPRDGEIMVRMVPRFKHNGFNFALQVFEADHLDEKLNDERRNICMGVQRNRWNRPAAYHILEKHPGDSHSVSAGQKHRVLPADQVLHLFVAERPGQVRGIPWTVSAGARLHSIGKYEESELVSARVGAAKGGFFQKPATGFGRFPGDSKDSDGNLVMDVEPGKLKSLPAGWEFKKFDIDHPNAGFEHFIKAVLKGAAAGLNVQYASLTSDLREANFGSLRQGLLEERDAWMIYQAWLIQNLLSPIFKAWLPWAIASGQVKLPPRKMDKWLKVYWQGRRWSWIDPAKDMAAARAAQGLKIKSRTRLALETGTRIEDVLADEARENRLAKKHNIDLNPPQKGTSNGKAPAKPQ